MALMVLFLAAGLLVPAALLFVPAASLIARLVAILAGAIAAHLAETVGRGTEVGCPDEAVAGSQVA